MKFENTEQVLEEIRREKDITAETALQFLRVFTEDLKTETGRDFSELLCVEPDPFFDDYLRLIEQVLILGDTNEDVIAPGRTRKRLERNMQRLLDLKEEVVTARKDQLQVHEIVEHQKLFLEEKRQAVERKKEELRVQEQLLEEQTSVSAEQREIEEKIETLEAEVRRLGHLDMRAAEQKYSMMQENRDKLIGAIQEKLARADILSAEIEEKKNTLRTEEDLVEKMEAELTELRGFLSAVREQKEEKDREHLAILNEGAAYEGNMQILEAKIRRAKSEIEVCAGEEKRMEEILARTEEALEAKKQETKVYCEEKQKQISEVEKQLYSTEFADRKEKLDAALSEREDALRKQQDGETQLQAIQAEAEHARELTNEQLMEAIRVRERMQSESAEADDQLEAIRRNQQTLMFQIEAKMQELREEEEHFRMRMQEINLIQ
ncbi:MAG: hypothetical protein Q4B15_01375 [Lachnospiraceae bacterium]|nr:hypothetical protein [Lachnospiraceae bacterium]